MLQPAQRAATIVQTDPMRKPGPGKGIDLQDVVKEFDQLEGSRADLLDLVGLLYGIEIVAHVVDAAAGRRNNVVEARAVAHEQGLGAGAFSVEPTVRHWLSAGSPIARISAILREPLVQF